MEYFLLNKKEENKNLIVLFNGWAMNESPFKHIQNDGFDILILSDYRNFDFNFKKYDFSKYLKKYLICWSMGVYVCNLFYSDLVSFDKKIAINGTMKIIDNDYGIPEKIYHATAKFLNETSKDKFIENMFNKGKLNPEIIITREINELKEELISIQNIKLEKTLDFDKAIISKYDRIIPYQNQVNFWKNRTPIVEIQSTHCPFEIYKNWLEIIC